MDKAQMAGLARSNKAEQDLRKWCVEQASKVIAPTQGGYPGYFIDCAMRIEDYVQGRRSTP